MENEFSYYFTKHLTDKHINGYSGVYNDYCGPRRNDPIKLLEIGIGTLNSTTSSMLGHQYWTYKEYLPGASLRAFKEYFPNGEIYGVDTQEDCMFNDDRIHTFLIDSKDKEMCEKYFTDITFDFIIDDGDHHFDSQIKTFENFFPKLNKHGVYILEDLAYPEEIKKYFETTNYNCIFRDRLVVILN